MQLDTYLANSDLEDLRAIVRSLLATGPSGTTSCFTSLARTRVQTTTPRKLPSPNTLFIVDPSTGLAAPTKSLYDTLARARGLFGVGLGFESLPVLTNIIRRMTPLRWEEETEMETALCILDADVAQAVQSCREQLLCPGDLVPDLDAARQTVASLRAALRDCEQAVEAWGGEYPLEKSDMSIKGWKF